MSPRPGLPAMILACLAATAVASSVNEGWAQTSSAGSLMPLAGGVRWIYEHDGREALIIESLGRKQVKGVTTTHLGLRGGSLFWEPSNLYVAEKGGALLLHATRPYDRMEHKQPPWVLIGKNLVAGASWENRTYNPRSDSTFGAKATVIGREKVTTPTGTYDAVKIEFNLTCHLGTEYDLRLWFARGVGFVKISRWRRSTLGKRTNLPAPLVYNLTKLEHGRPLDVTGKRPSQAQLRQAIEVVASATKQTGRIGQPLPVRFVIRNKSKGVVPVLPALDGSDVEWRGPKIAVEVRNAKGVLQRPENTARCGMTNPLDERDFRFLRPGEELDPFGAGSFGHFMTRWTPTEPGAYTVKMRYDTRIEVAKNPAPRAAGLIKLIKAMPGGVFESNTVTIQVR